MMSLVRGVGSLNIAPSRLIALVYHCILLQSVHPRPTPAGFLSTSKARARAAALCADSSSSHSPSARTSIAPSLYINSLQKHGRILGLSTDILQVVAAKPLLRRLPCPTWASLGALALAAGSSNRPPIRPDSDLSLPSTARSLSAYSTLRQYGGSRLPKSPLYSASQMPILLSL